MLQKRKNSHYMSLEKKHAITTTKFFVFHAKKVMSYNAKSAYLHKTQAVHMKNTKDVAKSCKHTLPFAVLALQTSIVLGA